MVPTPFRGWRHRAAGRDGPDARPPSGAVADVMYAGARLPLSAAEWISVGFSEPVAKRLAGVPLRAATRATVTVIGQAGAVPLRHFPFHSRRDAGLDWGFDGAGPRDLARAMLLAHFAVRPTACGDFFAPRPGELPVSYERFHSEVIAELAIAGPWTLTSAELPAWIEVQT